MLKWLNNYMNEKDLLSDFENSRTVEYIPQSLKELPLLQLRLELSPDDFLIEQNEIIEQRETVNQEYSEDGELNPFGLDQDFHSYTVEMLSIF
jgi:hypothetical protein